MRRVWGLAALWSVGCAHERPTSQIQTLAGKHVLVETTASKSPVDAIAEQSPSGLVFRTESGDVIAPDTITDVFEVHHGRGALEGLGIGIAIGLPGGAIYGYAASPDCGSAPHCFEVVSRAEQTVIVGVFFGAAGAAVGALIGAVSGSPDIYWYRQQPPTSPGQRSGSITRGPRITPIGPPGSVGGVTITW